MISSLSLVILIAQCVCLMTSIEAGKGKVPIYMPIPIPIPMPMGPRPERAGHDFGQQQQQQQQHHGGEGAVKKIYLLQSMPRPSTPSQFKGAPGIAYHPQTPATGGGYAPANPNHGGVKIRQPPRVQSLGSYGDNGPISQVEEISADSYSSPNARNHLEGKDSHSDLKILPIVVIPPIAPMPPIQLHQGNNGVTNEKAKISFTPQFNNYLMTNNEPNSDPNLAGHSGSRFNEQKSFSDYGGSVGGSVYRDAVRGPSRRASISRQQQSRPVYNEMGQSSWASQSRVHQSDLLPALEHDLRQAKIMDRRSSNFRDNGHHLARSNYGRHQHSRNMASIPAPVASSRNQISNNSRRPRDNYRSHRATNSIKDIMETVSFDDELDHDDYRQALPSTRTEYYNNDINERRSSSLSDLALPPSPSSSSPEYESESNDGPSRQYISSPSSIDRRERSQFEDDAYVNGNEDEWRYDTVNSVIHVSPIAVSNSTQATATKDVSTSSVKSRQQSLSVNSTSVAPTIGN